MDQSCENCRMFLADTSPRATAGWCRRFPPAPPWRKYSYINTDNPAPQQRFSAHPRVTLDEWCGEWKPKS
jgi:hypothetical protein